MAFRKHQLAAAGTAFLLIAGGAFAQETGNAGGDGKIVVTQEILDRLNAMQKTIDDLRSQVNTLEKEKAAQVRTGVAPPATNGNGAPFVLQEPLSFQTPATTLPQTGAVQKAPAPPPGAPAAVVSWGAAPNADAQGLPRSLMSNREDTTGRITSSPRPDNAPIDPYFKGFMRLWDSETYFKFGGYVRANMDINSTKMADNTEMIPSGIPVKGEPNYGSNENVAFNGKASRIDFELRRNTEIGPLRIYYENDFFGGSTQSFSYHFRQFYAQAGNLLAGQASTTFTDDDIWPDIVDYEGPNSAAYVRQMQVRYTIPLMKTDDANFHLALAVEQPDSQVDLAGSLSGGSSRNRQPDYVARLRYETKDWHVQLAGLVRDIGYTDGFGGDHNVIGGGGSLTAGMNVFGKDRIGVQLAGGYGVGRYFQDVSGLNADAALTNGGDLRALPAMGAYLTYTHYWADEWRSSITGGYLEVVNESGQADNAFHRSAYASANVIWQPTKAFWIGAELLYGFNQHRNDNHGDAWQVQLSINYDFVR